MTLEEALEKSKTQHKKVFIDVYTDWCGWCKRMDDSTFSDPAVAKYLNDNFYAVKLNAEQQQDITYKGKVYHFKKNGARGYHELASTLLNNRLIFPTTVFLDENQDLIQALPNYVDARKMEDNHLNEQIVPAILQTPFEPIPPTHLSHGGPHAHSGTRAL